MAETREPIILASASPRRLAILARMSLPVIQRPVDVDETLPDRAYREEAADMCEILAERKVTALLETQREDTRRDYENSWIVGADTIVFVPGSGSDPGRILGKPGSRREAEEYLRLLSGKIHLVITGLALYNPIKKRIVRRSDTSEVVFKTLTKADIAWYLDCGEWVDAAGGYKIQEKGECLITGISGAYSNVIGLPMPVFYDILCAEKFPTIIRTIRSPSGLTASLEDGPFRD